MKREVLKRKIKRNEEMRNVNMRDIKLFRAVRCSHEKKHSGRKKEKKNVCVCVCSILAISQKTERRVIR